MLRVESMFNMLKLDFLKDRVILKWEDGDVFSSLYVKYIEWWPAKSGVGKSDQSIICERVLVNTISIFDLLSFTECAKSVGQIYKPRSCENSMSGRPFWSSEIS